MAQLSDKMRKDLEKHKGKPYESGQRYGHMVSVRPLEESTRDKWVFRLDNGEERVYSFRDVRTGKINGEGRDHNKTHGESDTRFYQVWADIKARIYNENHENYDRYGGRGIETEWDEYMDFRNDMYESYKKAVAENPNERISINRIDSDGNYVKENCEWLTMSDHASKDHRRAFYTIDGVTASHTEHAERYGINPQTVSYRINQKGMEPEEAYKTPVDKSMSRS